MPGIRNPSSLPSVVDPSFEVQKRERAGRLSSRRPLVDPSRVIFLGAGAPIELRGGAPGEIARDGPARTQITRSNAFALQPGHLMLF